MEKLFNTDYLNRPDFQNMQNTLEQYYSGPLSLIELARNAVRFGMGAVHFTARVRALHLPEFIKEQIVCAVPGLQVF